MAEEAREDNYTVAFSIETGISRFWITIEKWPKSGFFEDDRFWGFSEKVALKGSALKVLHTVNKCIFRNVIISEITTCDAVRRQ